MRPENRRLHMEVGRQGTNGATAIGIYKRDVDEENALIAIGGRLIASPGVSCEVDDEATTIDDEVRSSSGSWPPWRLPSRPAALARRRRRSPRERPQNSSGSKSRQHRRRRARD